MDRLLDLVPDAEDRALTLATAQPEVPVVEQEIDAVLLRLDRIVDRARAEDLQVRHTHLVATRCARLGAHLAGHGDARLVRQRPKRSHTSGGDCVLTRTACITPVPSRMTANATFPEERTCATQPRTVTC